MENICFFFLPHFYFESFSFSLCVLLFFYSASLFDPQNMKTNIVCMCTCSLFFLRQTNFPFICIWQLYRIILYVLALPIQRRKQKKKLQIQQRCVYAHGVKWNLYVSNCNILNQLLFFCWHFFSSVLVAYINNKKKSHKRLTSQSVESFDVYSPPSVKSIVAHSKDTALRITISSRLFHIFFSMEMTVFLRKMTTFTCQKHIFFFISMNEIRFFCQ